jgi:hemerythrin-like domain-containing protein
MGERREFLLASLAGAVMLSATPASAWAAEKKVEANEDLMREHGVLRRALLVYGACAQRLQQAAGAVPPDALAKTAKLFRDFGEDYHERRLEEAFIFPAVKKLSVPAARLPDILQQQHERGRELTDYVMRCAHGERIAGADALPLARALQEFIWMYENHAAREDTEVFTAWKASLSAKAYDEMGERFEDIEKQVFGHDGFDDAVKTIAAIESELGLADIARFTMPAPPAK